MVEANKTYVGVVEDNKDPKKIGRVKARVMDVYDEMPLEDIPWANPWKDLNGNGFNTPEIGKVVMVIFDDGNDDNPEFIYADHYNINLENKLLSLSDDDYTSMKSIIFDHKTQIYVNESEGLMIDHKYNNINVTDNGVDINLKDNNVSLNLGDATAEQQAILGNHFLDWLDEFLKALQAGGLMNGGGPALPNPSLLKLITEFQSFKDLKFLSHHVNIVDNDKVTTVKDTEREDEAQYGDTWTSTKEDNTMTEQKEESFVPKTGPKEEFNKPVGPEIPNTPPGVESPLNQLNTNNVPGDLTNNVPGDLQGLTNSVSDNLSDIDSVAQEKLNSIGVDQASIILDTSITKNSEVDKLISFMESKSYTVYKETNILNIVAMRDNDSGVITNKFDDTLNVFYLNTNGDWEIKKYGISTLPGLKRNSDKNELPEKVSILAPGQYIDQCKIGGLFKNMLKFSECAIHENDKLDRYNYSSIVKQGNFDINIKKSISNGTAEKVFDYSKGDQVFKNSNQHKQFMKLCENQSKTKDTFTYTLCRKSDFDKFRLSES